MQDLKVTLVQANQLWEDKVANFSNYEKLLKGVDTDLIVLPEMFNTGFSMNTEQLAEGAEESLSIQWLRKIAQEKQAAIYSSLIIRDGDHVFNRGVFAEPNGRLSFYDKRKTFGLANEDLFFASGTSESIVEYAGWKFQLQICYDLRFPEISRNRIAPNQLPAYDVLLYVANWPEKRSMHWNALLAARAIENQCYVVGVNRVGKDAKDLVYSGDSQVVDALGNVTSLVKNKETTATIVMKHQNLQQTREKLPFLKDC
jgi:predicted amidohydrolase